MRNSAKVYKILLINDHIINHVQLSVIDIIGPNGYWIYLLFRDF